MIVTPLYCKSKEGENSYKILVLKAEVQSFSIIIQYIKAIIMVIHDEPKTLALHKSFFGLSIDFD